MNSAETTAPGASTTGVPALAGQRAVVVGGGRNVGQAICTELAAQGASVAVVDIDLEAANRVVEGLEATATDDARMLGLACNVADQVDVRRAADAVWDALGGVDVLVNCVAITDRGKTVLDLTLEEWTAVMDVSLTGTFLCCQEFGRRMVDGGIRGRIVNIGSTSGHQPRANALAYPTAKSAVMGFTRSVALQLGKHGVRVNVVTPNKVGSPVGKAEEAESRPRNNLVGRACDPQDIAKAVSFLVSDAASFITGIDLVVDGGALISTAMD